MKRILLLVLAGALAAMVILYGLRIAERTSNAAVTAFLPRGTIDYEQHKIDIFTGHRVTLSTAYDGNWFFASNDVSELKALLDRADGRVTNRQSLLNAEEAFRAAMAKMPVNYALCLYVQPKIFAEKIAALRGALGQQIAPDQRTMLEQVRSVCGTTRFENGKMHDVIFAAMPRFEQDSALTRDSVALGTKDTFFYVASLLNLSN